MRGDKGSDSMGFPNTSIELEISFEEGLENNFRIATAKFPRDLIISLESGRNIDLTEWAMTLPVILCGVEDGEITEKGSGIMEFKNLEEARNLFPSLDLHNSSSEFTKALGDQIKEKLRFETWAAQKFYSE